MLICTPLLFAEELPSTHPRISHTNQKIVVPTGPLEIPVPPPPAGAVAAEPKTSIAAVIVHGRFTSVQVNVNAAGNNVVGDAANEPSMAIDPTNPNKIAIGWRQFDTISSSFRQAGNAYSQDGGQTWTFPGVLDPGQFRSDPVLASDANGVFYFSSLSSLSSIEVFKSIDSGVTWSTPVPAFGGDKQWIAVDRTSGIGSGNLYQIWNVQFSCCPPNDFTRSVNGGVSFQGPFAIPQPSMKWGTMDVGFEGTLYLAGATLNQSSHLVARSSSAQNPSVTPTFDFVNNVNLGGFTSVAGGPNPAGLLGQVWIATDHSTTQTRGNVYILASVNPVGSDPLDVHFIRSTDKGFTWSSPVRVNDDAPGTNAYQWFGTMSVAPNGRIDVVWNDTRNDVNPSNPTFSELYYSFSLDAGQTWFPGESVSPPFNHFLGYPQQNKLGDYYHMISDNGGPNLAYAATFNGEQDVYFVRITPDCNGNGIADEMDITGGTSLDCNNNLTPDDCEPDLDCNTNGVQDICDIAAGTSDDCNLNSVPDECEPNVDCNNNGTQDICDIALGTSDDCNDNAVPDECEIQGNDCNSNGSLDSCDLALGTSEDCNDNGIPDECDISLGTSLDEDLNGIPDECTGACCICGICSITTPEDCVSQGGAFFGEISTCKGFICSFPDNCAESEPLASELELIVPFSNLCATNDGPPSISCDTGLQPMGTDLWYTYHPPCCGELTVSLCDGTFFDSMLAVYGGGDVCECPSDNSSLLTCGDDTCGIGGGPSIVTLPVLLNRCYLIRIGGWNSSAGAGEMQLSLLCDPDNCPAIAQPFSEPGGVEKSRYIAFVPDNPGMITALEVILAEMPNPFTDLQGTRYWVDEPIDVVELVDPLTITKVAALSCNPIFRDWSDVDVIHVFGSAVVPEARYEVRSIPPGCNPDCSEATPLSILTGDWGDVIKPFSSPGGPTQPTIADILALVDKWLGSNNMTVSRSDLEPQIPDQSVTIADILQDVDAWLGAPYPFDGPKLCP